MTTLEQMMHSYKVYKLNDNNGADDALNKVDRMTSERTVHSNMVDSQNDIRPDGLLQ